MTNKKVTAVIDESKRKVLIGAATGAALVGAWQKPVVDAVISPAHAMMSVASDGDPTDGEEEQLTYFFEGDDLNGNGQDTSRRSDSLLDLLIKPAYAGAEQGPFNWPAPAKAMPMGDGEWRVEVRSQDRALTRAGTLNEDSTSGALVPFEGLTGRCDNFDEAGNMVATIQSVTDAEMVILLETAGERGDAVVTLPVGDGEFDTLNNFCIRNSNEPQ